jgi:ParB family chromosome partitioning protein
MQNVALSELVASRNNPRRVKPEREAHRKLVASIKAHGLLEPLVVRPENGHYRVIAGNRRLDALRAVYDDKTAVPCVVRQADAHEAEELSLTENFTREAMHPLDEAEAFARMASVDRKGVSAIAVEFGVTENYVRQRMKLASLCEVVKTAYRSGEIDTATAEAFAAVPQAKQIEVWEQVQGKPRHADHIRNLIEDRWIPAADALFDVDSLPEGSVSTDLFRECVLVERGVFMQAQAAALTSERERLIEDGWKEVVVAERDQVRDKLYSMSEPQPEWTPQERKRLEAIDQQRRKIEERMENEDPDAEEPPELEQLDREEQAIGEKARGRYGEATKCRATAFLVLNSDGTVERHYRVPRVGREDRNGYAPASVGPEETPPPPTANQLCDRQKAALFAHEAIAVRHAVLTDGMVRKRLLVLALHDKVRTDALALRQDANATTLHAIASESVRAGTFEKMREQRSIIDPFKDQHHVEEVEAYQRLCELSEGDLDRLIEVLIADMLTGSGQRETPLLDVLAQELNVNVRQHWTPDADWLSGYQKVQLADLVGTLKGKVYGSAALGRKKSELVEQLAALFSQAANQPGGLEDKALADHVNRWTPRRE